jgi:tetrahydromethanopterin S-methyltransferase subunit C
MIASCGVGIVVSIAGLVCLSLGIVNTKAELWIPGIVLALIGTAIVTIVMRHAVSANVTEQINPVMKKNKSDTNLELMAVEESNIAP